MSRQSLQSWCDFYYFLYLKQAVYQQTNSIQTCIEAAPLFISDDWLKCIKQKLIKMTDSCIEFVVTRLSQKIPLNDILYIIFV